MEDAIAEERFPLPIVLPGLAFWYRGPARELRRRAAFEWRLNARFHLLQPLHPRRFVLQWFAYCAFLVWLQWVAHGLTPSDLWLFSLAFPLGIVFVLGLLKTYRRVFVGAFDRRARRYFEMQRDAVPAAVLPSPS
jgi:hypothetical protein